MKSSPFHPLVLGLAITGGLSLVSALQGRFRADLEFQAGLSAEQPYFS